MRSGRLTSGIRASSRAAGATLALCSLTACYPALIRHSPEITGVLTLNGAPVSGAAVYVQSDANDFCNASPRVGRSDEQGRFEVAADRRLELYSPISFGDRGSGWRVCFDHEGRYYLGYTDLRWGLPPERARLECDLAAEPTPMTRGTLCRIFEP